MSKTPPKPAEQPSAPVPTHGGVYEVKDGVLVPIAGGPPAAQNPATEPDPSKAGES